MNKIFAISSTGKTEKSFLDLRFGKCEYIAIYDANNNRFNILENPYKNERHSGLQLLSFLKKEGVTAIITGEVGPLVSEMIQKEKLQLILLHEEKIRLEEIVARISKKPGKFNKDRD